MGWARMTKGGSTTRCAASHTYASSGTKTITTTARDANNFTTAATRTVTVTIGAPRNGLIGEYLFNNFSFNDTSGGNRHLTVIQQQSEIQGAPDRLSQPNQAVRFLNTDILSRYGILGTATTGWDYRNAYTVSARVKRGSGNGGVIVGQGGAPALALKDNKIRFGHPANPASAGDLFVEDPQSLPLNTWVHYAVTASGSASSRTFRLYRDGMQIAVATKLDPFTYPANPRGFVGGWGDTAQNEDEENSLQNGVVDSVRIYNRALNATEIGFLANDPQ